MKKRDDYKEENTKYLQLYGNDNDKNVLPKLISEDEKDNKLFIFYTDSSISFEMNENIPMNLFKINFSDFKDYKKNSTISNNPLSEKFNELLNKLQNTDNLYFSECINMDKNKIINSSELGLSIFMTLKYRLTT